jgi:hypothetical protein
MHRNDQRAWIDTGILCDVANGGRGAPVGDMNSAENDAHRFHCFLLDYLVVATGHPPFAERDLWNVPEWQIIRA